MHVYAMLALSVTDTGLSNERMKKGSIDFAV